MTDDEVDSIARYLAHEVNSVPIFDDDATNATTGFPTLESARDHYRGHARAILRTVRSLGWAEPQRLAGESPFVFVPPVPFVPLAPLAQWGTPGITDEEIGRLKPASRDMLQLHDYLDNATATIIEALTSSDLIESATVEVMSRSNADRAGLNFDRLRVAGRLRVDSSAKFTVQLDVS